MKLKEPEVKQQAGTYSFRWPQYLISISVRRLHEHRVGNVTAEVTISTDAPGYGPQLHQAMFNLSSTQSRTTLAKHMGQRYANANWTTILEQLCSITLQAFREGEPAVELFPSDEIKPPTYLLYPFLQLNKPTVIFGEGGEGKSLMGLLMAITVTLPWADNALNFVVNGNHPVNVLWLDYETDQDTIGWNLSRFTNGLGIPEISIHYRRCSFSLASDIEKVQSIVAEKNIGLLVIDSLGMACAGDLNTSEIAMRFWEAQRQLNVTTLIIAHPSKDQQTKKRTIHGSGFFSREARSVWELRQVQEPGEEEKYIGLFHTKVNEGKLHRPRGFRLAFSEKTIEVYQQDVSQIEGLRKELGTGQQILELLKSGAMSVADIRDDLELSDAAIRMSIGRLKKRNKIIPVDDKWGLPYEQI